MHKLWCGNACCDCVSPCELDKSIPCSPDCAALNEDGSRDIARCVASGCDAYACYHSNHVLSRDEMWEVAAQNRPVSREELGISGKSNTGFCMVR